MIDKGTLIDLENSFTGKLLTAPEEIAPYLTDWRGIWTGNAIGVARPDTAQDAAKVVRWCAANRTPIVPQGGNTGLSGGATPDKSGRALIIALDRLNRVRSFDAMSNVLEVEAGCTLQNVQEVAEQNNRLFPLSLASEGTAQVGGVLATNAGGTHVFRYGGARELCLSLEVALPDGELWSSGSSLYKDNSGYALRQLFVGSEGTLGVITAASLRLFPQPVGAVAIFSSVASLGAACGLYARARDYFGPELTACEYVSDPCIEAVLKHIPDTQFPLQGRSPGYVLLEISSWDNDDRPSERALSWLEKEFEDGNIDDAAVSESLSQFQNLWGLREHISESQSAGRFVIKHDIALPLSQLSAFDAVCSKAVAATFPTLSVEPFGHLGDGNLHYNVACPPNDNAADRRELQARVNRCVHDLVIDHGGSISAEHGLGVLRRDEAARYKSATHKDLMARIKASIDPAGLMNPGKLLAND